MSQPSMGFGARAIDRVRRSLTRRRLWHLIRLLKPRDAGIPLVRVGDSSDGGYLIPDDLGGVVRCFSPGVGAQATFELALLERGIPSTLIDGTVDAAPDPRLDFTPVNLGALTGPGVISMRDWIARFDDVGDLLLQMDIEGGEFEVIPAIPHQDLARFRIIVLELHLFRLHDPGFLRTVVRTLRHLHQDFEVVHLHPNNCCGSRQVVGVPFPRVVEATLLRRDRISRRSAAPRSLPHPLDARNVETLADIRIPPEWHRIWRKA